MPRPVKVLPGSASTWQEIVAESQGMQSNVGQSIIPSTAVREAEVFAHTHGAEKLLRASHPITSSFVFFIGPPGASRGRLAHVVCMVRSADGAVLSSEARVRRMACSELNPVYIVTPSQTQTCVVGPAAA